MIGWHNEDKRKWPVGYHQHRPSKRRYMPRLPPRGHAEQKADNRERRLHRKPAFVRRLPLPQKCGIIQQGTRRMLRHVDIKRRASEEGSRYKGEVFKDGWGSFGSWCFRLNPPRNGEVARSDGGVSSFNLHRFMTSLGPLRPVGAPPRSGEDLGADDPASDFGVIGNEEGGGHCGSNGVWSRFTPSAHKSSSGNIPFLSGQTSCKTGGGTGSL